MLAACAAAPVAPAVSGYLDTSRIAAATSGLMSHQAAPWAPQVVVAGGDRWLLATAHAELRPRYALQHFDCALGIRSASGETKALERALAKVFRDAMRVSEGLSPPSADRSINTDGRTCRRSRGETDQAGQRSLNGAMLGAAYGEVLAAAAPASASSIRRVGHEIGLSQAICGFATPDEVMEGEALGRRLGTEIVVTAEFRAHLPDLRREVQALQRSGLTHPGCAAERLALSAPAS
jgi:acid phosphatase (class A)